MSDDEEFGPWCADIGEPHGWGDWMPSMVDALTECRFCSKCGGMEQQSLCTDLNCDGKHHQHD